MEDADFRPVEDTKRIRPDEVDRRALPFKKRGDRRTPRQEAGQREVVAPAADNAPASVWSQEAAIDPRDLPSALAPSTPEMARYEDAPQRKRAMLPVVVMLVACAIGFGIMWFMVR